MTQQVKIARRPAAVRKASILEGYDGSETWIDNIENPAKSCQIQANPAKSWQ